MMISGIMQTKPTQNMETKNYAKAMASMLTTLPGDITLRWFLLGSGVLLFAAGLLKLLSLRQEIKFFPLSIRCCYF